MKRVLRSTRTEIWGLWLDVKALLADDGAKAIKVLQRGLKSKEHAAFLK